MARRAEDLNRTYFGRGYHRAYRDCLIPEQQTRQEAAFLARALCARCGSRWLDAPCGYGRHLAALRSILPGLRVTGIDLNFNYLGHASAAPTACADLRRLPFAPASFDAVLNLLNSFGYFPPDRGAGVVADRRVLAGFARVLRPRGWLAMDLSNRRAVIALVRRQPVIRYAGPDWEVRESFAWDPATQTLSNRTRWRWREPSGPNTRDAPSQRQESAAYRVRLFTPGQITQLLEAGGFEVRRMVGGFRGQPFDPADSDRMLVLARRA